MSLHVRRDCRTCSGRRDPPREPRWSRWTGEANALWPLGEGYRAAAPEPGERVEVQLEGPFELQDRARILFVPSCAHLEGFDLLADALPGVRLVELSLLSDLGDGSSYWMPQVARLEARVERVIPLAEMASGDGPSDRPAWAQPGPYTRVVRFPGLAFVRFDMQGDVSGSWWLQQEGEGWRLLLELDDAGLHYGWAYTGGHLLDEDERRWLEGL